MRGFTAPLSGGHMTDAPTPPPPAQPEPPTGQPSQGPPQFSPPPGPPPFSPPPGPQAGAWSPPPPGSQPSAYQARPPSAYAHWGQRVLARLLDMVVMLPFGIVGLVGVVMFLAGTVPAEDTYGEAAMPHLNAQGVIGVFIMILGWIGVLAFFIWNEAFRQGRTGQSLGKKWIGITLIGEQTGQPIGAGMSLLRQILHVVDGALCDLGYLWPLWDDKRQTFADMIVRSVVVPVSRGQ